MSESALLTTNSSDSVGTEEVKAEGTAERRAFWEEWRADVVKSLSSSSVSDAIALDVTPSVEAKGEDNDDE